MNNAPLHQGICVCCEQWRMIGHEDGHCRRCAAGTCEHDENKPSDEPDRHLNQQNWSEGIDE